MAVQIKFDKTHNVIPPTFILATRSGKKLGKLKLYNLIFKDGLNTFSEFACKVNKVECDNDFWEQITDFKLVWSREWNMWFEIRVSLSETDETIKNITAKSLGESELSQINLYDIEINTETDMEREDYEPTILFDEINHNASLLHRISKKIPHYSITHVDHSIKNIKRTFEFDDKSIYDALNEISKEINCLFIIKCSSNSDGKIIRTIEVYDIESYCEDCGTRGNFDDECSNCGSHNIVKGYGQDTSIFVSTINLADQITYSTDVESVKNCFKLEAGDDLMTATVANCNPNGSGYIWYISDEIKKDMSSSLVSKINQYDELYNYYKKNYQANIDSTILGRYNNLITKYSEYTDDYSTITSPLCPAMPLPLKSNNTKSPTFPEVYHLPCDL